MKAKELSIAVEDITLRTLVGHIDQLSSGEFHILVCSSS
jgi:hypothetical protein